MVTKKKPAPLRDQIIAFLTAHDEATLNQIAAATTERDFPSRVTTELNKMRTDAIVECAKKPGKNQMWYWLPQAAQSSISQPAVEQNTGSSALADSWSPPAEGAAVQPEPATGAVAPSTAPVAADVEKPWLGYNAGPRDRASHTNSLSVEPHEIPAPQYDPNDVAFRPSDDFLLAIIGQIRDAISDQSSRLSELPARILSLWLRLEIQTQDLEAIHNRLAERVCGGIDPADLNEVECAERAARMIDELLGDIPKREAELRNSKALIEKLEHLLQSARNESDHLRAHAHQADVDMVNHPPHYQGKVECIDAIEAALGPEGFAAYCRGNAIKYSFRAGRKGPCAEDLAKAQWYLARATGLAVSSSLIEIKSSAPDARQNALVQPVDTETERCEKETGVLEHAGNVTRHRLR